MEYMINEKLLSKLKVITPEEKALLTYGGKIERALYMKNETDIIDSAKLLNAGELIDVRVHTRFVHFPEHRHNYVEAVYTCSGSTIHIINGKKITLNAGELLFLGQGASQEIFPAGENDIAVNFIILPQFFDRTFEYLGNAKNPLQSFIADSLGNNNAGALYFKVADIPAVQNLIENLICALLGEPTLYRGDICRATMGVLFMQLLEYTDRLVLSSSEETATVRVLKYIEENYRTATLTEIAGILHYDLYWLSREITLRTGKTYKELLKEKRLFQAAYLLTHSDLKVSEIGDAVGYSNLSYFHRIFFEKYKMTPKKYRMNKIKNRL